MGTAPGPSSNADSRVWPAGQEREVLQERHRLGTLLEHGGFGSVCSGTCPADGAPVSGEAGGGRRSRRAEEEEEGGGGWG